MSDQPRPVWLDRSQRNRLEERLRLVGRGCSTETDVLEAILASWDAAPADSPEAIAEALFNNSNEPGESAWKDATSQSDEWVKQGYRDGEAPAVLRALGFPS